MFRVMQQPAAFDDSRENLRQLAPSAVFSVIAGDQAWESIRASRGTHDSFHFHVTYLKSRLDHSIACTR